MPKEAKSAAASEATATLSPAFSPQREFCYAEQHVSLVGYQAGVDNRFCNEKCPNCGGNVGTEGGQFALFF